MVTRRAAILASILTALFLIMTINVVSAQAISVDSVTEKVRGFYETSTVSERIMLLAYVIGGIAVLIVFFVTIKKLKSKKKLSRSGLVQKKSVKYRTDLDTLYEMLKREKKVSIEDIEKSFGVEPEVAFDWSKILENGDLAVIDYPRFGKPVLKLVEENAEPVKEEKLHDEEEKELIKKPKPVKVQKGKVAAKKASKKKPKTKPKKKHSAKPKKKGGAKKKKR